MTRSLNRFKSRVKTEVRRLRMTVGGQILILINHAHRVPKPIKQAAIILISVHILDEVPSMVTDRWPKYWTGIIDPYFSPWFHLKVERGWFFKDITEDIAWIGTFYAFCKIALQYSVVAFLIVMIFLCYHILGLFFYLWNFKQSHIIYWDVLWYAIILQRVAISPSRADNFAKIKSLF